MVGPLVLDTSAAIALLNDTRRYAERLAGVQTLSISVVTLVELIGGRRADDPNADLREAQLRDFVSMTTTTPFDVDMAEAYGRIVAALGFSRRQVLDRMIAATALVLGATLVTLNPDDFRAIPHLRVEAW